MSKDIEREYDIDDSAMMERAQLFHDNFEIDKADFTTLFPTLADPFNADFQALIDAADAIPSGSAVDSQIAVVTENLNNAMDAGRKAIQVLYTYAQMRWNSKVKSDEFGKSKYGKMKRSQTKLPELIEEALEAYAQGTNAAELLEQGYTQAMADDLQAKGELIETLNRDQEVMKSARGGKTETRVKAFNAVWGEMKKINKASKVVYADSPAGIEKYLLYQTVSQSLPKPQNLTAQPDVTDPAIANLIWDVVAGATDYKVYFSEVNLGEPSDTFAEILEVSGINGAQVPLLPNKRNYWKIKAFGGGLSSAYSDEVFIDAGAI